MYDYYKNPLAAAYSPTVRPYHESRGDAARRTRSLRADHAASERMIARFWRDNGPQRTVDCVVTWLNATFGTQLVDLPEGYKGNGERCPIATALYRTIDGATTVDVDGPSITVYGVGDDTVRWDDDLDEWVDDDGYPVDSPSVKYDTPVCVRTFVQKFDAGELPQYAIYVSSHGDY